jgi:hypothetical protein
LASAQPNMLSIRAARPPGKQEPIRIGRVNGSLFQGRNAAWKSGSSALSVQMGCYRSVSGFADGNHAA